MPHARLSKSALRIASLSLSVLALSATASAAVTEPDGTTVVPLPLSEDISPGVVSCCGVLADGSNISLDALFRSRGEAIQWQADASTEPNAFSPLCGFRGSLILRGGGCQIDFGWYNVDPTNPNPPLPNEIYPLVSIADIAAYFAANPQIQGNAEKAFHPNVFDPPVAGVPIQNLRADPRYRGGLIGLATLGNDIGSPPQCSQTHFTEPRLNPMSIYGQPWILALMWRSTTTPNAFYIGFEDLPVSTDNFRLPTSRGYMNDGDINDFVYFVEGITCEGGGQPCLVTAEGACGYGLTECQPDGTVSCVQQLQPSAELCDNIDNDCNGLVDDGSGLCPPGEVCDKGVCHPPCSGGEFPCESIFVCETTTGICIDPACTSVTCQAGQVCMAGQCVGGCTNVVCPWGQICQLGRCVDPCQGRTCPSANQVCEGGVCVEGCQCRVCAPGLTCDMTSGRCVPPGCAGGAVQCAANQVCLTSADGVTGACQNKCGNVICPGGASCDANTGNCNPPLPGNVPNVQNWTISMMPDGGLVRFYPPESGQPPEAVEVMPDGSIRVIGPAVLPDGGGGTGATAGTTGADLGSGTTGCSCRTAGGSSGALAAAGLLVLGLGLGRRRRRRA
jgi:MYXO-CTERM domain-containing protein